MNVEDIKKSFEQILATKTWWKRFIGSQFVDGFSTFVAQMVYRCNQFATRSLQEAHLSTAITRPSILAKAEDNAYVGRKVTPSHGKVRFQNKTAKEISIPVNEMLVSSDSTHYLLTKELVVPANGHVIGDVEQRRAKYLFHAVEQETKYLEIVFNRSDTRSCSHIDIFVTDNTGATSKWERTFLFRGSKSDSKAYTEFYRSTDQIGVRFGNGLTGLVPKKGWTIQCVLWQSKGDITLMDKQKMSFADARNQYGNALDITTETIIDGGAPWESIRDIRQGAKYQIQYNNDVVWDLDYIAFIKSNIAGITWINVWGERLEEKEKGKYDIANINRIFMSAYAVGQTDIQIRDKILALFEGKPSQYNLHYQWRTHRPAPFKIKVTGKTFAYKSTQEAISELKEALEREFGKDSHVRKEDIKWKDIWVTIEKLGILTEYTIVEDSTQPFPTTKKLADFIFMDVNGSTFTITN